LRLAQHGLSVRYEPRSTVTHVRYGSGGSDNAADLSQRHRRLFVERWGSELTGRPWTFPSASKQAVIAARDALASPRVLICAPAEHPGAEQLALMLLHDFSRGRVTWATGPLATHCLDPNLWLRTGVEVVDQEDPSWLDDRLFHYDLVVLDNESDARLPAALERTQPQAGRVTMSELDGSPETLRSRSLPVLLSAGIAPPTAAQ
jgi:hypothetical protein